MEEIQENYFGSYKKANLIEEPKNKINIFEEFKSVTNGKVIDESLLVPIFKWYSNNIYNINKMQNINRYFFWVNKKVLCRYLTLNVNKNIKFIKTLPKKEDKPFSFLIPYICKYYNWSDKEWFYYKDFFDLSSRELHLELDRIYAFEKNECKLLGIKRDKINIKFEKTQKTKKFF